MSPHYLLKLDPSSRRYYTVTYGDLLAPTSLGSGGSSWQGGNHSAGGGAIKLTVAGTLTVNGTLSAIGDSGGLYTGNGGGAGGSVWLNVGTLAGSGSISANGGIGDGGSDGAGGGGRIAITYRHKGFAGLPAPGVYTNLQSISSTVTVKGGYNTSADGPEDGSIDIGQIPMGTAVYIR